MILFLWVNVNKMNSVLIFFTNICIVNKIKKNTIYEKKIIIFIIILIIMLFFYINYEKGILVHFYLRLTQDPIREMQNFKKQDNSVNMKRRF